jgi:hypothetical protein
MAAAEGIHRAGRTTKYEGEKTVTCKRTEINNDCRIQTNKEERKEGREKDQKNYNPTASSAERNSSRPCMVSVMYSPECSVR